MIPAKGFLTLFVVFILSWKGNEVRSMNVDEDSVPALPNIEGNNQDKSVNFQLLRAGYKPHFESKKLMPGIYPMHMKKCWEKCKDRNAINVKELLIKQYQSKMKHQTTKREVPAPNRLLRSFPTLTRNDYLILSLLQ